MGFQSTQKDVSLLYKEFSLNKKHTLIKTVKDAFTRKKLSFYQKQVHIYEKINEYSDVIGKLLENNTYTLLSKHLFEYLLGEEKKELPSQKDIFWVLDALTQIHNFAIKYATPIENHFILYTSDSTFFSSKNKLSADLLVKECKNHLEKYSELLLIESKDLEQLLIKTKLYYPSLSLETIFLGVGANIRFSSRMGELLDENEEWEQNFRIKSTVLDPSNLHLCTMLDEEELISFIEESEEKEPSQLIDTIIKQLTLEEFYRKENEHTFARISNIILFLPKSVYHNLSDPVRKLYTFTEYLYNKYTALTLLPLSIQSELLNYSLPENTFHNFESIESIFSQINIVAEIILYISKEEHLSLREQEKLVYKYCELLQSSSKFPLADIISLTKELYSATNESTRVKYCSLLLSFSVEESLFIIQNHTSVKNILCSEIFINKSFSEQRHHILTMLTMQISKPFSDLYSDNIQYIIDQYLKKNTQKTVSITTIRSFIETISLSCTKLLSLENNLLIEKLEKATVNNAFSHLNSLKNLLFSLNKNILENSETLLEENTILEEEFFLEDFETNNESPSSYSYKIEEINKITRETPPIQ